MTLPLIVLVGATATGKSGLAIDLARRLAEIGRAAEVINADSMCVYRGMDIGTAKPSLAERAGIVHHLIDIMEVTQSASVADFQRMAREKVAELRSADTVPIMVGGSSLYNRAITDHFDFPGTDPAIRARWQTELDRLGPEDLHEVLAAKHPRAAAEILPGNGRRIVRALEVIELTGDFRARLPGHCYALDNVHQFGLRAPREVIDQRIAKRVEAMWAAGLVDEVRALLPRGLAQGPTASLALGYQQVLAFLNGECSEQEARQATIVGTRRFSRKQMMWFARDPRITWLDIDVPDKVGVILAACGLYD